MELGKGLTEHRKRVLPLIQNAPATVPDRIEVSGNAKTGASINSTIVETCQPTGRCMEYCYGKRGPVTFKNSILLQHRNVLRFNYLETATQAEVDAEALRIAYTVLASGENWIRWNGVGDLVPGSVRVVNALARLRPDITQWVVSRKVVEVGKLEDLPSIKILFSLDETTPDTIRQRAESLASTYKRAAFRFAWTRTATSGMAPPNVSIVFNEHIGKHHGAWSDDVRVCAATLPGNTHTDTCATCRRCFA